MNTESSTETDPFPISPEQMKWPFRTEEERKKIIKWQHKQKRRGKVNELDDIEKLKDIELAPY
jgi:hypothetical protein